MPRLAWMRILLAGQLICAAPCQADAWQHAVTTRVASEFETNPAMSSANPTGVWRALLEPGYTLTRSDGIGAISTGLALKISRSSNKTLSPDRENPNVFLNWARPSEAGEFGASTRYFEIATRDSGGVDATGGVPVASTRTSKMLSGSWNKEVSERSTLSVDGAYEKISFMGGGAYTNYSTRSGGVRIGYILDDQIASFCRVSGNRYMPVGGGPTSSSVDATLGMDWNVEYWTWTMQVAKSRVGATGSYTLGSIVAHYTGERAQLTLDAGRSVSPSGRGGFVKADHARGGWSYALSEYSNTGIDLARSKNHSAAMSGASTNTTMGAWVDRNLTSFWRMRTYLSRRTNQMGANENVSSNMLGVSFAYENFDF